MKDRTIYLIFALLALLQTACQSEDKEMVEDDSGQMPVYLRIPADGGYLTRSAGDPGGIEEALIKPTTLYLYVVTDPVSGAANISKYTFGLTPDSWQKASVGNGDAYYEYNKNIKVALPASILAEDRKAIRVYAAVTPVPFSEVGDANSEEAILNLKVSLSPVADGKYDYIKDIYSTPADYQVGGNYYGSAEYPTAKNPSLTLTLYHVAAKIDVMWNVADALQSVVRLRQLQFRKLRRKDCLVFRPMQNSVPAADTYQVTVNTDVGSQSLGRCYFYAMPCKENGYMPLEVHLWQADDNSGDGYEQSIQIPMTETVFTPWVREDLVINKQLISQ